MRIRLTQGNFLRRGIGERGEGGEEEGAFIHTLIKLGIKREGKKQRHQVSNETRGEGDVKGCHPCIRSRGEGIGVEKRASSGV